MHLSALGFPIVGDEVYGAKPDTGAQAQPDEDIIIYIYIYREREM